MAISAGSSKTAPQFGFSIAMGYSFELTPSPRVVRILVPEKQCYAITVLVETPFMYISIYTVYLCQGSQ